MASLSGEAAQQRGQVGAESQPSGHLPVGPRVLDFIRPEKGPAPLRLHPPDGGPFLSFTEALLWFGFSWRQTWREMLACKQVSWEVILGRTGRE